MSSGVRGTEIPPRSRLDELENRLRHLAELSVALAQFIGDVDGHITDHPSTVLKATMRTGLLNSSASRSRISISRSVAFSLAPRSSELTNVCLAPAHGARWIAR
jgi:hypothetical protein